MTQSELQAQALNRATSGTSLGNFPAIYAGFVAKGIPESQIKPRENVLTYNAWQALGRQVRKGEKGVKVGTYRDYTKTVTDDNGEQQTISGKSPRPATVFHISQTDPIK